MNNLNKGLALVLGSALISGVSIFLNKFAVSAISNSDVFTTVKNLAVGLVLTGLILLPIYFSKLKNLKIGEWLKLFLIGFIGGSIPFLLFFKGLSMTNASSAAFIHKTLFLWVSFLAVYFLKEKLGRLQYFALALLFLGNFTMLGFKMFSLSQGELLVLGATLMWAIEFVIAKKVLASVPAEIVAWARMFFGAIILLSYLVFSGQTASLISLNSGQWFWVAISSILLLGYVFTWYKALAKLPVVVVTSVLVLASPITTCLELIYSHKINNYQIGGSVLIVTAIILIFYSLKKLNESPIVSQQFN
ncbi:MAG: DMT family transporter [Candidatus Parcubacteria bacterium]|nr:DMT family transporter [Candidatus Parcubacteria bacterium]